MATITITDQAASYLKKCYQKQPGHVFRLTIKKTGCSGYSYVPEMIKKPPSTDVLVEPQKEVSIYLDLAWLDLLDGLHIDYVEENKQGLKQKRLVFNNNKEAGRCGCGESFHV